MRPMPININITKDVEAHGDRGSDTAVEYSGSMADMYGDRKTKGSDEEIATVH